METTNSVKPTKRLIAYLIDCLLVSFVLSMLFNIKVLNPTYDNYVKYTNEYTEFIEKVAESTEYNIETVNELEKELNVIMYNVNKNSISYNFVTIVVILLYFGVFQKYTNGQTIGKKLMKMKVISSNKKEISLLTLLGRYSILLLPGIGGIISLIINTILILCLNMNTYLSVSVIINDILYIIGIAMLVMIIIRKDHKGLHDLIFKTEVVQE